MRTRTARAAFCLLLSAPVAGIGQVAPPAPQMPIFKTEVEYVEVDVRVTDAQGRFVRDLAAADFQVFEDGKPQKIAAFSLVDIPIELESARAISRADPLVR